MMRPFTVQDRIRVVAAPGNGILISQSGATGVIVDIDDTPPTNSSVKNLTIGVLLDGEDAIMWFNPSEIELL